MRQGRHKRLGVQGHNLRIFGYQLEAVEARFGKRNGIEAFIKKFAQAGTLRMSTVCTSGKNAVVLCGGQNLYRRAHAQATPLRRVNPHCDHQYIAVVSAGRDSCNGQAFRLASFQVFVGIDTKSISRSERSFDLLGEEPLPSSLSKLKSWIRSPRVWMILISEEWPCAVKTDCTWFACQSANRLPRDPITMGVFKSVFGRSP